MGRQFAAAIRAGRCHDPPVAMPAPRPFARAARLLPRRMGRASRLRASSSRWTRFGGPALDRHRGRVGSACSRDDSCCRQVLPQRRSHRRTNAAVIRGLRCDARMAPPGEHRFRRCPCTAHDPRRARARSAFHRLGDSLPRTSSQRRTTHERLVPDGHFGLQGAPASGTLFATPASATALGLARAVQPIAEEGANTLVSSTLLENGVLCCRYLGPSAARAREHFARIWTAIRPDLLGRSATWPRIWFT